MGEDHPSFNNADKAIIQNIFNKMVDLISNNPQINRQARKAVREELEEGVIATSDYKIDASGRKYKAHRTTIGSTAPQVGDDPDTMPVKEEVSYLEESHDPPFVLVLKRQAIRLYPDGTKIALYYNDRIKRVFSIPYNTDATPVIQAEETDAAKTLETPGTNYTKKKFANGDDEDKKMNDKATAVSEAVDAIGQLQKIKDSHQHGTVNHKDGSASKIDVQTAHAVLTVHKSLNDVNKKKFADMVARSSHHMQKAADFSWKHLK